mgnify:CR=1 FL=1|jgi:hypothetical protein
MGKKLTTEEFIKRAREVHGDKYDYSLVEYKNYSTKVKIISPKFGVFEQRADAHLGGFKPKIEEDYNQKSTLNQFIKRAREVHGDKYDYSLVEYTNNYTKVKIVCPDHGVFEQIPKNHTDHSRGCKYCAIENNADQRRRSTEEFIQQAKEVHGNRYDYSLVDYKNKRSKVKIICQQHGAFEQIASNHLIGYGCGSCNESHGERTIARFLYENKLIFERQKYFKECKNINPLPFDFYLPEHNTCIEFDGEQHFRPVLIFGGKTTYEKIKINDKIKNKYCLDNDIRLIRIKYNQNIETILKEHFDL